MHIFLCAIYCWLPVITITLSFSERFGNPFLNEGPQNDLKNPIFSPMLRPYGALKI